MVVFGLGHMEGASRVSGDILFLYLFEVIKMFALE